MTLTVTLTTEANEMVQAHAGRQGSTAEAAAEDLIRRGAAHVDWREIREGVEDVRSTAIDTLAALNELAPYTLATLQLLAHWAAKTGTGKLDEVAYAQEARAVGRVAWEGHLTALAITPQPRPTAEARYHDGEAEAE